MKTLPSVSDVIFFLGIAILATGVSLEYGWTVAAEIIGVIFILFSILTKLRGHS